MLPNSAGGAYTMSIQGRMPDIALVNPTTATLTGNFSGPFSGVSQQRLYWRPTVSCNTAFSGSGYAFTNLAGNATSYTIQHLISGQIYDAWLLYQGTGGTLLDSRSVSLGTTGGCSAIQPAPVIKHTIGHCSRDTMFINPTVPAVSSYPYRIFWLPTGSSGYYTYSSNSTTNLVNLLQPNGHVYDFYYKVLCVGGAGVVSAIAKDTTCYGSLTPVEPNNNGSVTTTYEIAGVYYVDADIREVIEANEAIHPTADDGQVHFVQLHKITGTEENNPTATEETLTGGFELQPNPTTNRVKVAYALPQAGLKAATINVMDMTGRILRHIPLENPTQNGWVSIDLSDMNAGIYLVEVQTEGYQQTKKLVVQK